jgi:hypothetical protein
MSPLISFPPLGSVAIETLNGSNWPTWALCITALLQMNGLKNHIAIENPNPTNSDKTKDWDTKQDMVLGVLEMYCQKDV